MAGNESRGVMFFGCSAMESILLVCQCWKYYNSVKKILSKNAALKLKKMSRPGNRQQNAEELNHEVEILMKKLLIFSKIGRKTGRQLSSRPNL